MDVETEVEAQPTELEAPHLKDESVLVSNDDKDLTLTQPSKKAKTMNDEVRRVAEIVLVLSAMAGIRGGHRKEPTEAEVKLMSEARSRLAEVCKGLAPEDIIGREAIGTVIEDLGLNWKIKDQRLGFRGSSRLSIKERVALATKKKVEEAKKLSVPSAIYSSHMSQSNFGQMPSGHATSSHARVVDKSMNVQSPSGVFSTSLSASSHNVDVRLPVQGGRELSGSSFHRTDRTQGNFVTSNSSKMEGVTDSGMITSRFAATDPTSSNISSLHSSVPAHGVKYVQPSVLVQNHSEIAKLVMKVLQPKLPECPSWTPPSRDYMNRTMTCQLCKMPVHDVESIVICDSCEKGFHLKCLEASNQKGIPRAEWHCGKCLALSNGKPLPPKYGRVMRSLTPQKGSGNPSVAPPQPPRIEAPFQRSTQDNSANGLDRNPDLQLHNNEVIGNLKGNQELLACEGSVTQEQIEPDSSANHFAHPANSNPICDNVVKENGSATDGSGTPATAVIRHLPINTTPLPQLHLSVPSDHSQSNENFRGEELLQKRESVGRVEPSDARFDLIVSESVSTEAECMTSLQCSKSDHGNGETQQSFNACLKNVNWVGNSLRVLDGKTYYQSCCISGVTYEIYDYALVHSRPDRFTPSRLQAMWEDNKSAIKWISVKQCYFPADLPDSVLCPGDPEINEVYESNHESNIAAGYIEGPCEVMSPAKFVEKYGNNHVSHEKQPVFLCKWFYDEVNRTFHSISC